jgi:hypothetical protein
LFRFIASDQQSKQKQNTTFENSEIRNKRSIIFKALGRFKGFKTKSGMSKSLMILWLLLKS